MTAVFDALKVRSFGCAYKIELAMDHQYIFELHEDTVINK